MSISAVPTVEIPGDIPLFPVRKFSVREYHQMIETGILREDDKVELIEGWIVPKMPRKPSHDSVIQRATRKILTRLPDDWDLRVRCAITTADSEPEPDFAIVKGDADGYADRHPGPRDIALVIEVSDASLAQDRGSKSRLYSGARVPHYWFVNLIDHQVEVHSEPAAKSGKPVYRQRVERKTGDVIVLELNAVAISLPVTDFLA